MKLVPYLFLISCLAFAASGSAFAGPYTCSAIHTGPAMEVVNVNEDSIVLLKLYTETQGDSWLIQWDTSTAVATWEGVILTADGLNVKGLVLPGNGLSGELPSEIGQLPFLEDLNLADNDLWGGVPTAIGDLDSLKRLNLKSNRLQGSLPNEITGLSKLIELILDDNELDGSLPNDWDALTELQWLYLAGNEFSGSIPASLGNLPSLTRLSLANNEFGGEVPESFRNLSQLSWCCLEGNDLTWLPDLSALPIQAGKLKVQNNRLSFRDVIPNLSKTGNNYFPQQPITLTSPVFVPANAMSFSIPIPIEHYNGNSYRWRRNGVLHAVATINELIFNPVSEATAGEYEVEITNLSAADSLTLNSTLMTVELIPCADLDSVAIAKLYNKMNGTDTWHVKWDDQTSYQQWFGVDTDAAGCVTGLDLSSNGLTGEVPLEINALLKMNTLKLSDNQIQDLPELFDLQKLEVLNLNQNQLAGLPDFSELAALTQLEVQNNSLNFSDIEPLPDLGLEVLEISPQDSLDVFYDGTSISVEAGGDINSNAYAWYKRTSSVVSFVSTMYPFEPKTGGWYWCEVTNASIEGLSLISKAIYIDKDCPSGLHAIMTTICEDDQLLINGNIYDVNNPKGQEVLVGASQNGCDSIINIMLDFVSCSYIPSGFTPNNDGVNDVFEIPVLSGSAKYPECELSIFNRWGDLVYYAKPYRNDWDGRNKTGQPLPDGTYYFSFKLSPESDARFSEITIIR